MTRLLSLACFVSLLPACAFQFELTSQRTALENQIMGSYRDLDDDVLVLSATPTNTATDASGKFVASPEQAAARGEPETNQQFNADDIIDLKDQQIIGEANDGHVVMLPKAVGLADSITQEVKRFAELIVSEENSDRNSIWQRTIANRSGDSEAIKADVQNAYAQKQYDAATPGHWLQDANGKWIQKK